MPISRLARKLAFNDSGSISAPARNVNTPLPSKARKLIQSVFAWRRKKFPATNQTFSNIKPPTDTQSVFAGVLSSEPVRAVSRDDGGQTPLPTQYLAISLVKLNRNSLNRDAGRGTSALALFQESRAHLESCRPNAAKSP